MSTDTPLALMYVPIIPPVQAAQHREPAHWGRSALPPGHPMRRATITQACLNVAEAKSWSGNPHGYLSALESMWGGLERNVAFIVPDIRAEFRKLEAAYAR